MKNKFLSHFNIFLIQIIPPMLIYFLTINSNHIKLMNSNNTIESLEDIDLETIKSKPFIVYNGTNT